MSVLKIHLTYQCTSECAHCRFRCTRDPSPALDKDLALECIHSLHEHNDLGLVVLMGGEPGLVPDLTYSLAAEAHEMGIRVRVETNAYWATDPDAAETFLQPLADAGASVMFSLDAFHEPHIPVERLEHAIRAAVRLHMMHNVEIPYLNVQDHKHTLDRRTDELLTDLENRLGRSPCCQIYRGNVLFNGRAADQLAPLVAAGRGVPSEICDRVPWWSDGWQETAYLLILDPEGYLSKGCGIAIGNVRDHPAHKILSTFDARTHPILSTLLTDGPLGLAHEAVKMGYVLRPDYADKCHLCQEARDVLWKAYPAYLTPAQHYMKDHPRDSS